MRVLLFFSTLLTLTSAWALPTLRGVRVDPAYFYTLYPNLSVNQIADKVVSTAKAAGVNTLFLYAYNSTYGSFYKTTYSMTTIETGYGRSDIFGIILAKAKANGLMVVANMPVNDFKLVWQSQPTWRSKRKTGGDYIPEAGIHLLSAWHPNFKTWLTGFYRDFLTRYPSVDAIEGVEPMVDYYWNKASDYNPAANSEFKRVYPSGVLGSSTWLKFRAQGLTDLIAILSQAAHAFGKKSAVVQTWAINPTGTLYSSESMRDGMGFDFNGILNLRGTSKVDYMQGEFMWQQWKAEHGTAVFTPEWTRTAAQAFISYVGIRSFPIVHVEISPFEGTSQPVTPTNLDLYNSVKAVADIAAGIDTYDYNQIESRGAWSSLSPWMP